MRSIEHINHVVNPSILYGAELWNDSNKSEIERPRDTVLEDTRGLRKIIHLLSLPRHLAFMTCGVKSTRVN